MAASVNNCHFIGHVGQDPKTNTTKSGAGITNVSLATSHKHKDQSGASQEVTTWVKIVFMGTLSEVAAKYIRKGSCIYVDGRYATRKYTGQDGIERYDHFIVASNLKLLDKRPTEQEQPQATHGQRAPYKPAHDDMDDDIPF